MIKSTISVDDIHRAAKRIAPYIRPTPILENERLNELLGLRLLVKAECLQYSQAFKLRGCLNNLIQMDESKVDEGRIWRGVCAGSAGNHAQSLAMAGQWLCRPVTILMPLDAPDIKVKRTKDCGALIRFYNRDMEDRDVLVQELVEREGYAHIHSYNNLRTIAGQGTIGLEIHDYSREHDIGIDAIVVNCSGGGLSAGVALSRDLYRHPPGIYTAEPEGFDDARRSFESGKIEMNDRRSGSICDALLMPKLGDLTFPILRTHKVSGFVASDCEVMAAIHIAYRAFDNLVVEPGGAVALASIIRNRNMFPGQTVVAIASGGNIDADMHASYMREGKALSRSLWNLDI